MHRRKRAALYGLFIVLLLIYSSLRGIRILGIAQIHTLLETIAAFIAFFVGTMGLVRFYSQKASVFLFLGLGFLCTGVIDTYHVFATSSFFIARYLGDLPPFIPWSEMTSRLFLPIVFWLSWIIYRIDTQRIRNQDTIISITICTLALGTLIFFIYMPLPSMTYFPELVFPQAYMVVSGLFYAWAFWGYWRKGDWKSENTEFMLLLALAIGFMSETFFMASSRQLFDALFVAAHILKVVSYLCILVGLLISMFSIFKRAETSLEELSEAHSSLAARSAELSLTNRDLETLLHVVSHDIKEPLRTIRSFSDLMIQRYASQIDSKGQEFLNCITRGCDRMRNLLEDITSLSQARLCDIPSDKISCPAIVEEVLDSLEPLIVERQATVNILPNLPDIQINQLWATQAIYNLVSNALKHTRDGVPVEVEIGPYCGPEGTGIVVRDRGPGVSLEHQERIFQLFQRTVGREIEGTGAGLAIVRQVAERHRGRAWVQPRDGGGSEFIITFGDSTVKSGSKKTQMIQ